jgi:hypothetical protein
LALSTRARSRATDAWSCTAYMRIITQQAAQVAMSNMPLCTEFSNTAVPFIWWVQQSHNHATVSRISCSCGACQGSVDLFRCQCIGVVQTPLCAKSQTFPSRPTVMPVVSTQPGAMPQQSARPSGTPPTPPTHIHPAARHPST